MNPVDFLRDGATLILSISGGKDSDAMSYSLLGRRKEEKWPGDVVMIHADLGRAEWAVTPQYVKKFAARAGVELNVVHHNDGDLIDLIWRRYFKDPSRPCWPSSAMRYCTSDMKRAPISRWIRNNINGTAICAMGLRAEESPARAKRPVWEIREDCTAPTLNRLVLNWAPIHDWVVEEVWQTIAEHGGKAHPAYALGNERLSCSMCVLASLNDIQNGAKEHPGIYREYCRIEAVSGWSFRQGFWLSDLYPELLPKSTLLAVQTHKTRNKGTV